MAVGQKFAKFHSVDRLLALSARYVMATCLTHEDGVKGEEGGEWDTGGTGRMWGLFVQQNVQERGGSKLYFLKVVRLFPLPVWKRFALTSLLIRPFDFFKSLFSWPYSGSLPMPLLLL